MSDYGTTDNGARKQDGHVLFVWSPSGWTLQERDGDAPQAGSTVQHGERELRVTKIGPSPLPGDRRPCAYTLP